MPQTVMYQQTIERSCSLTGIGLHSGKKVSMTFYPAPPDMGIVFIRTDLSNRPHLPVSIDIVYPQPIRCTCLKKDSAEIHTLEHLMAACYGLQIDNITIEIDGAEIPGMDGSAAMFCEAFQQAGIQTQATTVKKLLLSYPLELHEEKASICALPYDGLRLEYTLEHDQPFPHSQIFATEITPSLFAQQLAPARTFVLKTQVEQLQKAGMGKGANLNNTLVIDENGSVVDNVLRFPDEFARHKLLDLLGDLTLLGKRLNAHIIAKRSGHVLNAKLVKMLAQFKNG